MAGENPSSERAVAGFRQVSVFSSVITTARASVRNGDPMIHARGLTKRFGSTVAVRELSFEVRPGTVTGFLGPNGSGKSTTMRLIMGLDSPDAGTATIGGRPYRQLRWPLREVGVMLEARSFHPGRSARGHLAALAASNDIPRGRVDEVLGQVGLQEAARRRAGKFSLGMAQRLGVATALLGDPGVLMLDEPVNGLDPEGSGGSGSCSSAWLARAGRCSCPAT
jgi:ABC-2 type transport system ATP-binding protein